MDFFSTHYINYFPLLGALILLLIGQLFITKKTEEPAYKKYTRLGWIFNVIGPVIALAWGAFQVNSSETEKQVAEKIRKSDSIYERRRWETDSLKLFQITDTLNRTTEKLNQVYQSSQQQLDQLKSEVAIAKSTLKTVTKVDLKTDQEFEVTGHFNFPIDSSLPNNILLVSYLGDKRLGDYNFPELRIGKVILLNINRLQIYAVHYQFFVNADISDIRGNQIVYINDNKWRLNKNAISRFNYDENGLEIFDNAGRVVISIDFNSKKGRAIFGPSVHVQGVIPLDDSTVGYYRDNYDYIFSRLPYGTHQSNKRFFHLYDSIPIKPLFEYTGNRWRRVRKK